MEKMRRDFEFVSALRYVAIEIGVQGFRPRTPAQVLANRYGDCKDKANLLIALLRCQEIDARFVLLNRGSATDVRFPSWQFNHAIAYVPKAPAAGQPEDMWLDSTDGVTPFGYVPPGDFGRDGLVFSQDTAEFKKVTGSSAETVRDSRRMGSHATGCGRLDGQFSPERRAGSRTTSCAGCSAGSRPGSAACSSTMAGATLWPDGDFSKGTVSDVSDLRQRRGVACEGAGARPGLCRASARTTWSFSARPSGTAPFG